MQEIYSQIPGVRSKNFAKARNMSEKTPTIELDPSISYLVVNVVLKYRSGKVKAISPSYI